MKTEYELIVIGAGPAGVTAATTARGLGIHTLLIDEQPNLGGNIYRNIDHVLRERPGDFAALDEDYQLGKWVPISGRRTTPGTTRRYGMLTTRALSAF